MIDDTLNDTQQENKMSVEELKLNCYDEIKFRKSDQGFEVIINGNINWFDRSQAHLLMLYLQEHLK